MIEFLSLAAAVLAGVAWWRERRRNVRTGARLRAEDGQRERERSQAAAQERTRIFRDIHDDIGVKLLSLLHGLKDPVQADQVRSVMQDLRDVVSRSGRASGTLREVLAQIRDEAEQRLEALDVELDWQVADDVPDPPLDEASALHLYRITREAISNAIRHGRARRLRVRAQRQGGTLVLDYTDDGSGRPQLAPDSTGTESMRERAQALGGQIEWTGGTAGGAKVVLQFPLPLADAPLNAG